jgi:hypothetical protein
VPADRHLTICCTPARADHKSGGGRASCVRRARASLELGRPSFWSVGVPGASPTLRHPSAGRARSPATSSARQSLARSPSREGPHRGSPDEDRRRQLPAQAILRPHRAAGITLGLCGHDPIKARPTGPIHPHTTAAPRDIVLRSDRAYDGSISVTALLRHSCSTSITRPR